MTHDATYTAQGIGSSAHSVTPANVAEREATTVHNPVKVRVLMMITRLTIGGDTNVVLDIAEYLHHHPGYEVLLVVGPVPDDEADLTYMAHERGIPTEVVPEMVNYISPITNLRALSSLRTTMAEGDFDIVHTHSSVAGIIGRIAAVTARIPVVVHHVHGWGLQESMPWGMRILYLTLERICARFTDRMIAVARPNIQKGLANRICGEDKFALIYCGIDLDRFRREVDEERMKQDLGLDPESKIIGMIGRLDQQKNPLDFIRASALVAQDHDRVQFLIAGEGRLRPECEHLIRELGLQEKFFLLGFRDDIDRLLPILTVTAMSSLWEGLPIAFIESMSAGKPIVANNVDGAGDAIIDGVTGFLVTPRRPTEMAERISILIDNDELCREMGEAARHYSERFSDRQMVTEIDTLYRELLVHRVSSRRFALK